MTTIVADTGAIIALLDSDEEHHADVYNLFMANPRLWVLPWAILPEVDFMLCKHVGRKVQTAFLADIADGAWQIDRGAPQDLMRAYELHVKLSIGLVDGVVMSVAERLGAEAIATLDMRCFASAPIRGKPLLFPRDL